MQLLMSLCGHLADLSFPQFGQGLFPWVLSHLWSGNFDKARRALGVKLMVPWGGACIALIHATRYFENRLNPRGLRLVVSVTMSSCSQKQNTD